MDAAFERAVSFLSPALRHTLLSTDEPTQEATYEIRLRAEQPVVLFGAFGSMLLQEGGSIHDKITNTSLFCASEQLTDSFNRLCNYSVHTHLRAINNGFVTTRGGDRVGVVGTAVCDEQERIVSVREITALNVRVARSKPGCADELVGLFRPDNLQSVLIAGAPSAGKTTLLRDLARQLSSFENGFRWKLSLIDPRQELAPDRAETGLNCDVYRAYPKRDAVLAAVKTMSPQLIVCDEIGTIREAQAIELGVNTGVHFVASVHAATKRQLVSRPLFRYLLEHCAFQKVVLLKGADAPGQIAEIFDGEALSRASGDGSGAVSL